MKKLFVTILALAMLFCAAAAAAAAPAVTDGTTTCWIVDQNYLLLQSSDGTIRKVSVPVAELLQMTEDEVYCLTQEQEVIAVRKDNIGYRKIDNPDVDSLRDQRTEIVDGKLTLDGNLLSQTACAAATDGIWLYYAEKNGDSWNLRMKALQSAEDQFIPGSREATARIFSDRQVPEPLSLTVTKDALTLTGIDHKVTVMDLNSGVVTEYPASGNQTAAACMMNDVLYRYTQQEDGKWETETASAADTKEGVPTSNAAPDAAATPNATATPEPTATPAPTATPKPTATTTTAPTATPTKLIDDDGTVHRGATGSLVRKIQSRLAVLGYPTGDVDGSYGEKTQLAINLFCNAIHVKEHNYIPPSVQKKLFADDAPEYDPFLPLQKGDEGESVRYMQRRLKELGYDPGKVDGIYGSQTISAVARFQKDYAIEVPPGQVPGEVASSEMLVALYAPQPSPESSSDNNS